MPKYRGPEFEHCYRCTSPAGQLVDLDGREEALCHECWSRSSGRVLHWINRYGRLMFAPGSTTGPFKIRHR